ncbi:sec-independent periplasmic protein translocation protein TatC [Streptococcus macedonicus]|uniref:Sec-independent periplasmic protein translocation protein TatC n=1 Tax=Streptococcus macedonicus TaxID=59310 RepID=A0A2G3NWI6_STRMC|nr:sec-independent periplasmic protein translocation protein TatC [Streptococcus macedonicus]PHV57901.1 sec-independent periplasmic protein translocation protein TatC [Streptococcus macedonicus]
MKMNFRNLLVSNLITVIIIFVLLSIFDHSGDPLHNIIIVFVGFIVMTIYDFVRTRRKK